MSLEKKNKGRNPAARVNDSTEEKLVQKFLEMQEPNYARSVVIPVLEAEGYHFIDFHHGNTEVGKDLIFYRDTGFEKRDLIVAVVKTDKLSKTSSDSSGLPVILVQVHQAMRNEVLRWDGTKKCPDQVFVILADNPSHDVLTSSPDGFRACIAEGARFITGTEIATSLIKHRQDIAEQLLQTKLDASEFLRLNPTNLPLLHALNSNEITDIESIFTELDAAVGATTVSKALSLVPSPTISKLFVRETSWKSVSSALGTMEELIGTILRVPCAELEKARAKRSQKANTKSNILRLKTLKNGVGEIGSWIVDIAQEFGAKAIELNNRRVRKGRRDHATELCIDEAFDLAIEAKDACKPLEDCISQFSRNLDVQNGVTEICVRLAQLHETLNGLAAQIHVLSNQALSDGLQHDRLSPLFELDRIVARELENTRDLEARGERLMAQAKGIVHVESIELDFDFEAFSQRLQGHKESLWQRFKSPRVASDRAYARNLLEDTRKYLFAIDAFSSVEELSEILVPRSRGELDDYRLGACVLGLLNSGVDVLITGNAGAGKSTTLEMFARQRYSARAANEEVLFLPLARFGATDNVDGQQTSIARLCDEVARLFRSGQRGVTSQFVKEKINGSKRLVLVMDGIDEAEGLTRWIVDLISELRISKGQALQVIASSRFAVPELAEIGLFNLVLLPFSREQVIRFVRDFLRNEVVLASEVISHLESNPTLFSVAQTPLMATILCVLARNGVVLPETKNALYKERFELLWGAYDAKKQLRRVKSSRGCLEDVSKKIAYYLHFRRLRSAPRSEIRKHVVTTLAKKYRQEVVEVALDELERPCNVLVRDVDDALGFGHLSYQEYLAADELYTNRQAEIVVRLPDPWWRGVLVLVAMKSDDIGTIIEDRIVNTGMVGDAKETLSAMIEVCDEGQQKALKRLFRRQEKLDSMVDLNDHDGAF